MKHLLLLTSTLSLGCSVQEDMAQVKALSEQNEVHLKAIEGHLKTLAEKEECETPYRMKGLCKDKKKQVSYEVISCKTGSGSYSKSKALKEYFCDGNYKINPKLPTNGKRAAGSLAVSPSGKYIYFSSPSYFTGQFWWNKENKQYTGVENIDHIYLPEDDFSSLYSRYDCTGKSTATLRAEKDGMEVDQTIKCNDGPELKIKLKLVVL